MGLRRVSKDSFELDFVYYNNTTSFGSFFDSESNTIGRVEAQVLNLDTANLTFSGTFSGTVVNFDPPYDTLRITDGRFDVTYNLAN